ncbi:MAG: lipopolysaccharide export system permease protein [Salibacteraceae bacterium]|jgi:lipopolysaccharide export system permease protein
MTFFITLFIFEMQFLWNYLEDMVGKGIEGLILLELFAFASANLVTMALPLAILLSSIMTFGNLGENYELVAMKSAGISLGRIMLPLVIFNLLVSGLAFYHSNYVMPVANLKFKTLLYDIMHQRPALEFKPGVFYKGIDGFVIRIKEKDEDGQNMRNIQIYDHSQHNGNKEITLAETGKMAMSSDQRYLVFDMFKVKRYKENSGKSHPFDYSEMDQHTVRFDLSSFQFSRTDDDLFKDHYEMLNLEQLEASMDTLNSKLEVRLNDYRKAMDNRLQIYSDTIFAKANVLPDSILTRSILEDMSVNEQKGLFSTAINIARSSKTYSQSIHDEKEMRQKRIFLHEIEWHKKFTLSFACLVLFFIGAPLGALIRKGGLGMPVVFSILIFIIYHIISITGMKLVKQGELSALYGMWMATATLLPLGAFLTYKATTDSVLLDSSFYTTLTNKITTPLNRLFRLIQPKKD